MAYIPKGNSAWLLRKAINRSDSAIADLETNMAVLARTASNTGTSATTQVLFNDAGIVNGDAGLVYNKTTDALTVTGPLSTGGTLAVTGVTTLTGAATVQGMTVGRGNNAVGSNTAFGGSALAAVTIAANCTAVGYTALYALTSGDRNTAFGEGALSAVTIGTSNTGLGVRSFLVMVSGIENTGVGDLSAYQATGSFGTAIGCRSLAALVAGDYNVALGASAGSTQTAGGNNGFFGAYSYADNTTGDNQFNYGNINVASHKFRAGDVVVGTGNVVMSTAGKGIDFTATANSSGNLQTSELLADYEEGTWVPTDASGAALVFTPSSCRYTKIGRAVTIQGKIIYPSTASTATAAFSGLPFAASDIIPLNLTYSGVATSILAYVFSAGVGQVDFYSGTAASTQNVSLSGISIWFSGTYMT